MVKTANIIELETPRLVLRQWNAADKVPFAKMSADPDVMRYFPATLDRRASDAFVEHCTSRIAERGWGLWAAALKAEDEFIGFVGLEVPNYDLPFTPCTEVGWRLAKAHWNKGYATEGAKAVLQAAFSSLQLEEVVSFTSVINTPSRRVMEKAGLYDRGRNFNHPAVDPGSPLCEHCLYAITLEQWIAGQSSAECIRPL